MSFPIYERIITANQINDNSCFKDKKSDRIQIQAKNNDGITQLIAARRFDKKIAEDIDNLPKLGILEKYRFIPVKISVKDDQGAIKEIWIKLNVNSMSKRFDIQKKDVTLRSGQSIHSFFNIDQLEPSVPTEKLDTVLIQKAIKERIASLLTLINPAGPRFKLNTSDSWKLQQIVNKSNEDKTEITISDINDAIKLMKKGFAKCSPISKGYLKYKELETQLREDKEKLPKLKV